MAKKASNFVCQQCGTVTSKWMGQCPGCNAWNSLVEEAIIDAVPKSLGSAPAKSRNKNIQFESLSDKTPLLPRKLTDIHEFDRVAGGGLVPGSVLLVGGDPGIGKSTLLLQVATHLSKTMPCLYFSGEESSEQIRLRAHRLGLQDTPLQLAATGNVRDIIGVLDQANGAGFCVIDSIQTMFSDVIDAAPGTVSQVRASAHELIRVAKRRNIILILVGHVTKEGMIAGPRVLEHMVDTVLYFEGDRGHQFRILRAVKNRFGATDEIGVFEMTDLGLKEVSNPSALFLSERQHSAAGTCVFAGMEGTRPLLVEVQALVAPSAFGTPRRAVIGWDSNRLAMILAVLEARCGIQIGMNDVFLNVAGGLKVTEPAADLAIAAALLSSLASQPIPQTQIVFGEIGLTGEVRAVSQMNARLKEAQKLGFDQAIVPHSSKNKTGSDDLALTSIQRLKQLTDLFQIKKPKPDAAN